MLAAIVKVAKLGPRARRDWTLAFGTASPSPLGEAGRPTRVGSDPSSGCARPPAPDDALQSLLQPGWGGGPTIRPSQYLKQSPYNFQMAPVSRSWATQRCPTASGEQGGASGMLHPPPQDPQGRAGAATRAGLGWARPGRAWVLRGSAWTERGGQHPGGRGAGGRGWAGATSFSLFLTPRRIGKHSQGHSAPAL